MFSLKEYREPTHRLPDLLPWAALIAPGVIWQKDGLLQKTVAFRGPDLLSSSPHELAQLSAQINNALMRLGSGWSLFVEAQRFVSNAYPEARWTHPAAWIADLERARYFAEVAHFDSSYFLTFVWQPPSDASSRVESFFYEDAGGADPDGDPSRETAALRRDLQAFERAVAEVLALLAPLFPSIAPLGDDETLTYLHSTISTQRHVVRTPDIPMYLNALLADEALATGDNPMLGDHFVLTCTVSGFPNVTCPGILDALNHLETEYRWVVRFIALDKADARALIEGYRKKWIQRRKGVLTMVKEHAAGGEESRLQNESAIDKAADATDAQRELDDDALGFGYFTTTVTVWDRDLKKARGKMLLVKQAIQSRGFVVQDETLNSREAWLGSLPGHVYANVRRPVLSTMNLAHLMPSSAVWTGLSHNNHLAKVTGGVGLPHVLCTTTGGSPFRLNLNVEDVGHTLILGPTGAGKSTLLAMLALQWLKYPQAQVIVFDKDRSARAATLAVGGSIFEPGSDEAPVAFQPLGKLETQSDRAWANEFVLTLFAAQASPTSPVLKQAVAKAIDILTEHPAEERTLSLLSHRLESFDPAFSLALGPYVMGGSFGQIFDAAEDRVSPTSWTLIEMGRLMQLGPAAIVPALFYLFRRIEAQFTGVPTLLILDEAWLFLSHPVFAERLQSWLKTLRKKNVYVVFATQEVADASRNSALQSTILSACATQIFLADPKATTPAMAGDYARLGLTPTEIETLASMLSKRDYYLRSTSGRRVFSLALGPAQLTFAGMSSELDHRFMDEMVRSRSPADYARAMLEYRGVDWAVRELDRGIARGRRG